MEGPAVDFSQQKACVLDLPQSAPCYFTAVWHGRPGSVSSSGEKAGCLEGFLRDAYMSAVQRDALSSPGCWLLLEDESQSRGVHSEKRFPSKAI